MVEPADLGIDLLYWHLRDAVLVGEAQSGRVVLWNPAAEALFGYAVSEAVGMPLDALVPERLRSAALAGIAGLVTAEPGSPLAQGPTIELPARHKHGHELVVELSLTPLGEARVPGDFVLCVIRDVTSRVRLAETLRRNEAHLTQAQETALLGSWEWEIATDTIRWSDQLFRIFGLTPGAVAGSFHDYLARVHPGDREMVRTTVGRALETGEAFAFEHRIIRPDGQVRVLDSAGAVAVGEDGRPVRMSGIAHDITDRKQVDEALARERDLLQALMDNLPDLVYFKDAQHRFTRVNRAAAAFYGLDDPAQAIGKSDFDVFPSEQAQQFWEDERPVLEQGQALLNRLERQAGEGGWTLATKVPIVDNSGQVTGLVGVSRDITDLVGAEAALRQSEERFRTAFAHAAIGMDLVDLEGHFLQVNAALCNLTGYSEPELLARTIRDITHPEDVAADRDLFHRLVRGEFSAYHREKRYLRKDGNNVWVRLNVSLVRDEQGAPLHVIGQVEDITARKEAEVALSAERELLNTVLEALPDAVYVKDTDSRFRRLNRVTARTLGIASPAEAVAKTDFDFFPAAQADRTYSDEQRVITSGEPLLNQLEVQGDATAATWWLKSTVPLRDATGTIIGIVGSSRDITELRQLELERDRLHADLEAELGRAAEIQAQLLPTEPPLVPGYQFAGICQPARQVGGDFFDWHVLPDGVDISLADVMGKSMSAALLMAMGRTVVRTLADLPPSAMLEAMNRVIFPDLAHTDSFITLFHAHLGPATGTLTYADAGHGLAFVQRHDGCVEVLARRGVPLGVLADASYPEGQARLQPGDTLVIYSDGLPDSRPELQLDPAGIAAQLRGLPDAQAMLDHLVALARGGPSLPDDLTIVVLHRAVSPATGASVQHQS